MVEQKEVMMAVRKLRMGESRGIGGIRAEVLKYGRELAVNILLRVCRKAREADKGAGRMDSRGNCNTV